MLQQLLPAQRGRGCGVHDQVDALLMTCQLRGYLLFNMGPVWTYSCTVVSVVRQIVSHGHVSGNDDLCVFGQFRRVLHDLQETAGCPLQVLERGQRHVAKQTPARLREAQPPVGGPAWQRGKRASGGSGGIPKVADEEEKGGHDMRTAGVTSRAWRLICKFLRVAREPTCAPCPGLVLTLPGVSTAR